MSSSNQVRVVIASPHKRNDKIREALKSKKNIDVFLIHNKNELTIETLSAYNPRYIFFPHWPWHVKKEIFENYECIIFHMTDLPFGRGGSPLQNLIVKGFEETKLSAIQCVDELDAGPIYAQRSLKLSGTAEEILSRTADIAIDMIVEIIKKKPEPQTQVGKPTIFKRRNQEDGDLSGLDNLKNVYDYIRMLDADGYPDAFINTRNLKFDFSDASYDGNDIIASVKISMREKK